MRRLWCCAIMLGALFTFSPPASAQGECALCDIYGKCWVGMLEGYTGCHDTSGSCSNIPFDRCGLNLLVAPSGVAVDDGGARVAADGKLVGGCGSWVVGLAEEPARNEPARPAKIII